jgi:transcription termination factor Rho
VSVLARHELQQSPLADLHALASELRIEGFRGLRRDDLIEAIFEAQGGEPETPTVTAEAAPEPPPEPEEAAAAFAEPLADDVTPFETEQPPETLAEEAPADEWEPEAAPEPAPPPPEEEEEEREARLPERGEDVRSGVLDVLPNGSGFMRVDPFVHSRDDVYVSPAQIRRCELRAADEITGPVRPPRRSERYPSLVRVDAVNGRAAEPPEERPHFADLTPVFATARLAAPPALSSHPFGRGSRVAVGGPPGAGATHLLREIVATLRSQDAELELTVLLAGVRPEEVTDWRRELDVPVAGGGFDRPAEELAQVAAMAVERGKRAAERGRDAVLVVDGLDALPPGTGRRLFGAARNTDEAGSLTVIASTGTAGELQRLATTRIVLEPGGAPGAGSGTLRAELLG